MKNLALSIILACTTFFAVAQEKTSVTITVTIDNIPNNEGKVLLTLHNQETFMKGAGSQNVASTINNGEIKLVFENVLPGEYAIMALHDENDNNKMDFELNGMPKESYGMSGNEMSFGPPSFGDAKFIVADSDLELNIRF